MPQPQHRSNGDDSGGSYASRPGDTAPNPDPTRLTTQLVDRAVDSFREVVETEKKVTDTRLNAIDQATKLNADKVDQQREVLREDIDRQAGSLRELIEAKIGGLEAVVNEKFEGIARRFDERDVRTEESAAQSRISLDAALAAAKEAVKEQNDANAKAIQKSEDATKEKIDALGANWSTSNKSLEDKISDLRSRVDRGESAVVSAVATRTETRQTGLDARALVFSLLGAAGLIVGVVIAVTSGG